MMFALETMTNPYVRQPIPPSVAWQIIGFVGMFGSLLFLIIDGIKGVRQYRDTGSKRGLAMCILWIYLLFACAVKTQRG